MAILQNATFQGTPHNEVRPGSGVRKSTVERWLRDQAAVYEGIVGEKVPNASAIAATPHVHDGTNGAIIPIPLFHSARSISFPPRDEALFDSGASYEGFYPFEWRPFYAPAGVSKIAVIVVGTPEAIDSMRITIQDSSLATVSQALGRQDAVPVRDADPSTHWFRPPSSQDAHLFILDVTPGAVNLFKPEMWDGKYDVGEVGSFAFDETEESRKLLSSGRRITSIVGLPVVNAPHRVPAATRPSLPNDTLVKVAAAFTSFDEHLVQNTRALPSYVLVNALKNDAMLYERLTGRPAGARSSLTHQGHTHDGADGADIDHALGSWAYGVLRPPSALVAANSAEAMFYDTPGSGFASSDEWDGHGTAPWVFMASADTDTDYTLSRHRVRMPALPAAGLAASTGKLKLAALVFDNGVGLTLKAAMGNAGASSFDTEASAAAISSGRQLITISGLECTRPELLNTLRLRLRFASKKSRALSVYGACLYYEA